MKKTHKPSYDCLFESFIKMQYGCNKSQKLFIEQAIKADIRLDGRKNT